MNLRNRVDGAILGELYHGDLPKWRVGICVVRVEGNEIVVEGENRHEVDRFEPPMTESMLFDTEKVYNLDVAARKTNEAIQAEHNRL